MKTEVLIVEDNPFTCRILRRMLGQQGYDVECAATVRDGMSLLDQAPPRLILDLNLPDGSGAELLKRIREQHLNTKVAVVTGAKDGDELAEMVLLHPDAFFTKPVDPTELLAWVKAAG